MNAELGIRSIGFGPCGHCGIVADLDGDNVKMIWCALSTRDADEQAVLADMLVVALSQDQHLLLVDWREARLVDLRSRAEIESYLE